jgi:hypothetical protein
MQNDTMSERERTADAPAEGPAGNGVIQRSTRDTVVALDGAQVMELVSNAYWTLLERFISLDGEGTQVPSAASADET